MIGEALMAVSSRTDRRLLISNLAAGGFWLAVVGLPWGETSLNVYPFVGIGAAYVLVASVVIARVYGREHATATQKVVTMAVVWACACVLWSCLFVGGDKGNFGWMANIVFLLGFGLLFGTVCFVLWQSVAFLICACWKVAVRLRDRPNPGECQHTS